MLPRERRYSFFEGVPKRNCSTNLFNLKYRARSGEGMRVAVVAGKKVDKKANVRNRVKRVFVEQLYEVIPDWEANFDLVFYLKSPIVNASREIVKTSILESLKKVGIVQ